MPKSSDENKDSSAKEAVKSHEEIWRRFMERDAYLEKLLEGRADFWISQSGDPQREKAAVEKIDKELNPEIDKVSSEVKELLRAFYETKGDASADLQELGESEDEEDDDGDRDEDDDYAN